MSSDRKCAVCAGEANSEDHCDGCGKFVCEECDRQTPKGRHEAWDHCVEEPEDDDEDEPFDEDDDEDEDYV